MSSRAWNEDIAVGVESMDAEHRLQVGLVSALEELVRRGQDAELVARTTAQLVDFTSVHFLSEELMMRLYAYPAHDAHKLEHGRLTDQVEQIRHRLEGGEHPSALAAMDELRSWLGDHIHAMDRAFASWCEKNGIHPR
ncbi:MAG TPA: bacteriohemerythrin [Anaeromyxobacteraceae bacterium]|nr:bacteriohemerythrin [Anaeromyxobacteraceae bacterium]